MTLLPSADTCVFQGYPTTNYGDFWDMMAGWDDYRDPDGRTVRGLVAFDLGELPRNVTVTRAVLRLHLIASWDFPGASRKVTVHRVTAPWQEMTAVWNNRPAFADAYDEQQVPPGEFGYYDFDVSGLVRRWYEGSLPNQGFMIRGPEYPGTWSSWRSFGTRESNRSPQLVVDYAGAGQTRSVYVPLVQESKPVVSALVGSNDEGMVEHPGGARIIVPRGAVPRNVDGGEGKMLFTIERGKPEDFGAPSTPPPNWQIVGETFRMGPEGFTFNTPIQATMPLPSSYDRAVQEISMFDYDHQAGEWKSVGGQVDRDGKTLSVDALHLCANTLMARVVTGRGAGAIRFETVNRYSFQICIEEYTLKYTDWDSDFDPRNRFVSINRRDGPTTPADGYQYWVLPQGAYTLSVAVYRHDEDHLPPVYLGYFQRTITIDRPHWDWQTGGRDYEFAVNFGPFELNPNRLIQGRPPCLATPTPAVDIGQVNVRLEWWGYADLDLWVVDPCGQRIDSFGRTKTCQGSVGRKTQDNYCTGFVPGRPENIVWTRDAPRGVYTVYVDYFDDCANAGRVQYTVRWWVNKQVFVRRGFLSPPPAPNTPGDEVLVTRFTR
jgi:hypothetical protein